MLLFIPASAQNLSPAKTPPTPADRAVKMLPDNVGDFRAQGAARPQGVDLGEFAPEDFGIVAGSARDYASADGRRMRVQLTRTRSASAAYSFLKFHARPPAPAPTVIIEELGAVGVKSSNRMRFVKGATFVDVSGANDRGEGNAALVAFARQLAETLEGEAGELPPIVLHLPEWEAVNEATVFAVTLPVLQRAAGGQPVLEAVSFEGGTEAVASAYGSRGRLVIVEFTTPQIATDNDARIKQRIDELRTQGKPVPSAYRRVGNYSVFAFDAPDETAAGQLIDGVKWEKDVRWLGENPNVLKRAQRAYYEMTGNTVLNVIIVSGISILACLGIGGVLGGMVFLHRRAQAATTQVYTDAGGMVRLNIDDMTPETDPTRLLQSGKR